jgi:hypothetical protein
MTYMEFDPETQETSYVLKFMGRGFVQGDPLAPVLFTLLQAKSREENNKVSEESIQIDYIDDYGKFARTGNVRMVPIATADQRVLDAYKHPLPHDAGYAQLPAKAFDYSGHPLVVMMGNSLKRMGNGEGGCLSKRRCCR